jgi:hypothetical protein
VTVNQRIGPSLIDSEVGDQLRDLATKEGCTLHTVLITLVERLHGLFCDDISDISLGSIMSTRFLDLEVINYGAGQRVQLTFNVNWCP